jgi:putative tributyrin esterase
MMAMTLLGFFRKRSDLQIICNTAGLLTIILFCVNAPSFAQTGAVASSQTTGKHAAATLRDASFHSASLNREMRYRILLPTNYDVSARRYPTLILLHGLYGDYKNWSTLTNLSKYACALNLIIAMPDAGNSWYVDSATDPADKYEDYIARDFIQEIDAHYRTKPEKSARAIAGLSMGGYAAAKFALKYPNLFSYVGGISAALDAAGNLNETHPEFRDGLRKAFGEAGNTVRQQNDVFLLLASADIKALPYFYLDCGSGDMFLEVNRKFVAQLQQMKIPYEFHEMPGGHEWKYWDGAIQRFLNVLVRQKFAERMRQVGSVSALDSGSSPFLIS